MINTKCPYCMINTKCPYCNYKATEHETLDEQKYPHEKDISFCINCGEVSQYKNKSLVKVDVDMLDGETKKEVKDIKMAWLKTRNLIKFANNKQL